MQQISDDELRETLEWVAAQRCTDTWGRDAVERVQRLAETLKVERDCLAGIQLCPKCALEASTPSRPVHE